MSAMLIVLILLQSTQTAKESPYQMVSHNHSPHRIGPNYW